MSGCSEVGCFLVFFKLHVLQRAMLWWWVGATDQLGRSAHLLQLQMSLR